jgi:hypothetical protein
MQVAMQIVHEINNRITARRAQDQKNFTANLQAIPQKYQEKLVSACPCDYSAPASSYSLIR